MIVDLAGALADPPRPTPGARADPPLTNADPGRRRQHEDIIVLIVGNEESQVLELDEGTGPRIADALANIPPRPSDDPP
jgi:hypothetical protein